MLGAVCWGYDCCLPTAACWLLRALCWVLNVLGAMCQAGCWVCRVLVSGSWVMGCWSQTGAECDLPTRCYGTQMFNRNTRQQIPYLGGIGIEAYNGARANLIIHVLERERENGG